MILPARQNVKGAVKLLFKHGASHMVGPGHAGQAKSYIGAAFCLFAKAGRAADKETQARYACVLKRAQFLGKLFACKHLALGAGVEAAYTMDKDAVACRMAKNRVRELQAQFDKLLESAGKIGFDADYFGQKMKKIGDEMAVKQSVIADYEARQVGSRHAAEIAAATDSMAGEPLALNEYDDRAARQLIDTIRVMGGGRLLVTFKGGIELERQIDL
jgi:hypothetical protein